MSARKNARFTGQIRSTVGKAETSYNGVLALPDEEWLQPENVAQYRSRAAIAETPLKDYVPEAGQITNAIVQEAQQQYMETHADDLIFRERLEAGPFLGQKNIGGGLLPDFYLIPAVRELTEEIKVKSTSMFGRLLTRAVKEMTARDPRFVELRDSLQDLVGTLNQRDQEDDEKPNELALLEGSLAEELKAWGAKVRIEVTPPEIEKIFELGTDLHLDDGIETTADRKGHGLQRALIFALLRSWAKALRQEPEAEVEVTSRQGSESVIFAMEEPELFLHPHAQKRLARSLRDIANTDEHQVLLCTHSTHFVDLDYYRDIAIVTKPKPEEGSTVRQYTGELFAGDDPVERKRRFHMAHWVNPDRAEMFFASRVVLVEGETEKVLLPFLAEKLGCYDPEISIIDCGAKHNLPLYMAIVNAFRIPYVVIHDEDPLPDSLPDDWSADKRRSKQDTFDYNGIINECLDIDLGSVHIFAPDFENATGVSKNKGKEKGKALAALDHFRDVGEEEIAGVLKDAICLSYG